MVVMMIERLFEFLSRLAHSDHVSLAKHTTQLSEVGTASDQDRLRLALATTTTFTCLVVGIVWKWGSE